MNDFQVIVNDGVGTLMALPLILVVVFFVYGLSPTSSSTSSTNEQSRLQGSLRLRNVLLGAAVLATVCGIALSVSSRNAGLEGQRKVCQSPGWGYSGARLDQCVDARSDIGSEGSKGILGATSAVNLGLILAWGRHLKNQEKEQIRAVQVATATKDQEVKRQRLATAEDDGIVARLDGAVCLGGSSQELSRGGRYSVIFSTNKVHVVPDSRRSQPMVVGYETLAIAITGQGERKSNLGLWGGGFGVKGAATGILAATVLNSLTSRTDIDTVVALSDSTQELYFHYDKETPEALRMRLAPVFVKLREKSVPQDRSSSLVTDLSQLAELLRNGSISEEEFAVAKGRLFGQSGPTG